MTEWVVLVNPSAGRRPVTVERIRSLMTTTDVRYDLVVPADRQAMRAEAVAAAADGRGLVVAGGDGSISTVVDAVLSAIPAVRPTLGILPVGSASDLARMFGLSDPAVAAGRLGEPNRYPIDVGRLTGAWGVRHFVNIAQAGVGAAAAESAVRLPRRFGSLRYPLAFAARLPRFPRSMVTLEGRRSRSMPALAVIFANGQFFAGGWNVAPKAMLVDGELDIQVIDVPKWTVGSVVPKLIAGTHLGHPGVFRRSEASATLTTDVVWPIEADGDYVGTTPVAVDVLREAVDLVI